jgi:hypothetical protein
MHKPRVPKHTTYVKEIGDGIVRTINVIEYRHWFVAATRDVRDGDEDNAILGNRKFFRTKSSPTDKDILADIFRWYGIDETNRLP